MPHRPGHFPLNGASRRAESLVALRLKPDVTQRRPFGRISR
jgi:hypothetical protein